MAADIKQTDRLLKLTTPAGADVLLPDRVTITEEISRAFTIELELVVDVANVSKVKYEDLVGNKMTLEVELPGKKKRFFNGMCSRISQGGQDERLVRFRAEVVPWLWLLTQSADCKVFQDKTIPDIMLE